jgi:hypothetical protein
MIQRAEEYPWSSARFHCGLVATDVLLNAAWAGAGSFASWSEWLSGASDTGWRNGPVKGSDRESLARNLGVLRHLELGNSGVRPLH